jgi:hypothetical protein
LEVSPWKLRSIALANVAWPLSGIPNIRQASLGVSTAAFFCGRF